MMELTEKSVQVAPMFKQNIKMILLLYRVTQPKILPCLHKKVYK